MKNLNKIAKSSITALAVSAAFSTGVAVAETKGKAYGDMRLRLELVDQDNALADAEALTVRTKLGYKTGSYNGFSAVIEGEHVLALKSEYAVPPTGFNRGEFSVVADPEHSEIDQAFVNYKGDAFSAKLGRQIITLDGHRFVGHVGWRQDWQVFDALRLSYAPSKEFKSEFIYIDKRRRIFGDDADIDSKDMLLNASYKTSYGKFVGYAYLLEVDNNTDNSLDTYGVSFSGSKKTDSAKFSYAIELATQEANDTFDTTYTMLEGGVTLGGITGKIGYEKLGSDDGARGFITPLATLHKFNGWSDQFLGTPAQGLEDVYIKFAGKAFGGKFLAAFHNFSSDESLAGQDDLGDEINLQYTRKLGDKFSGGIKLADYSAGDAGFGKVDTQKIWLWTGVKF